MTVNEPVKVNHLGSTLEMHSKLLILNKSTILSGNTQQKFGYSLDFMDGIFLGFQTDVC